MADNLPTTGGPDGGRRWLSERGLACGLVLTSEGLANVSGGLRTGRVFQGKLEVSVSAELEKTLGLRGLSFFANASQIHGTGGIDRDLVGGINTISNIEALPATRLSEAWFEQRFLGDTASFRVDQLTADAESFISD